MKKIKSLVFIAAVFAFAFSSCKKSGSDNKPASTVSMSLNFNGTAKNTSSVLASHYEDENTLQVIGTFSGSQGLSLMIQNIKVGTFNIASDGVIASFSTSADFANTYLADSGTVTITSYTSDAIAGTFQFTGTNQAGAAGVVTSGTFYAKVIQIQHQ
jgi:hypothetical protein